MPKSIIQGYESKTLAFQRHTENFVLHCFSPVTFLYNQGETVLVIDDALKVLPGEYKELGLKDPLIIHVGSYNITFEGTGSKDAVVERYQFKPKEHDISLL